MSYVYVVDVTDWIKFHTTSVPPRIAAPRCRCAHGPPDWGKVDLMLSSTRTLCRHVLTLAFALLLTAGCASAAPVSGYKVVAQLPHSTDSYTEGLLYLNGLFYEGTGLEGHSALMAVQPATGKAVQEVDLAPQLFGEGIVDWGPNLYEWTWKSHICFVYDRFTLRPLKQFTYTGEGWGMTRTATELITSDGTATLRFRDPNTFKETRHIVVKDGAEDHRPAQRARVRQGRDLRQRLALRPHRPHLAARRPRHRLDRPHRHPARRPARQLRVGAQRHRL